MTIVSSYSLQNSGSRYGVHAGDIETQNIARYMAPSCSSILYRRKQSKTEFVEGIHESPSLCILGLLSFNQQRLLSRMFLSSAWTQDNTLYITTFTIFHIFAIISVHFSTSMIHSTQNHLNFLPQFQQLRHWYFTARIKIKLLIRCKSPCPQVNPQNPSSGMHIHCAKNRSQWIDWKMGC